MKSSNLGQVLQKKGVGVTIGWDETNCLGQSTGLYLFQLLLEGYSVADAFQALPANQKLDYCGIWTGANLVYYPPEGGNMYLVDKNNTQPSDTDWVLINGVKWATRNVDKPGTFVQKPEDYGGHYTFYDAQNACPAGWRLPTWQEVGELRYLDSEKVTSEKSTQNGIKGWKFTDKDTGNTLFLPYAGASKSSHNNGIVDGIGEIGLYWDSDTFDGIMIYENSPTLNSWWASIDPTSSTWSIRPVLK